VKQGTLAVAEVLDTPLAPFLVWPKDHLDLADEFFEAQIDGVKDRLRIRAARMNLAPALLDSLCDQLDGVFLAERVIEGGAGLNEFLSHLIRPRDGAPQATAQEVANLGRAVTRGRDVDHLHARAINGVEIRAILILKFRLESADRPIANIDSALYGAIIDPRPFKAQPALEHALVVRHHLLKELRHSGLAGVFLGKLGESKNGFEREVTLGGRLFLSGGHMKVLAANATLLPSDAEHPE
jgi:hypothetical protein